MTLFAPLPPKKYHVIYCDPPWHYRGQVQHGGQGQPFTSGAEVFYPTVPIDDLCQLPVKDLIHPDGCALFLWVTGPILAEGDAHKLAAAWGFKLKTIAFVWDKMRVNPGAYTMSQTELVMVGTARKRPPKPRDQSVRQLLAEPRTEHSRKPAAVRDSIVQAYPEASRIELFARRAACADWDVWGNEVE